MYKRLIILSAIILAALCGLGYLGYHAISIWAGGLEGARLGEFAAVAEQIRQDVNRKVNEFMQAEQQRPYTDYQQYYVPDNALAIQQQQMPLLRSPLAGKLGQGLAYGQFQLEPDGNIITPNDDFQIAAQDPNADNDFYAEVGINRINIRENLLPVLNRKANLDLKDSEVQTDFVAILGKLDKDKTALPEREWSLESKTLAEDQKKQKADISAGKSESLKQLAEAQPSKGARSKNYPIDSFQNTDQGAQVYSRSRAVVEQDYISNTSLPLLQQRAQTVDDLPDVQAELLESSRENESPNVSNTSTDRKEDAESINTTASLAKAIDAPEQSRGGQVVLRTEGLAEQVNERTDQSSQSNDPNRDSRSAYSYGTQVTATEPVGESQSRRGLGSQAGSRFAVRPQTQMAQTLNLFDENTKEGLDMVQVRIEPFVPLKTPLTGETESVFDGQIFMLRHVQIEDKHFVQGFQLDESALIQEVAESAGRFMRDGMTYELAKNTNGRSAYSAILDFGFGQIVLNLIEMDPARIGRKISQMKIWYFGIITLVLVAVAMGLASLWLNARAQLRLARKKDDFISAVSHELRTPLTSIRMYSEMLEKNWVKSKDKVAEYYRNMRQESERLSRLIENVLDFSRIQRGRKKYEFSLGDMNKSIAAVVEMIRPYAAQNDFTIETRLGEIGPTAFDPDAVTQIVVNLIDNAIKYARNAQDKRVIVRTRNEDGFVVIEVEDHGPGIPHRQRKKIFEEFYRIGSEATRETTGTGLGLALVRRFAEAHNGFVEILSARPSGAIFRVALPANA
ncbi:MAG: HAMP domain-containing histidine kinase [Sedimentisphaerales bacterium]|nr:HAMP domain-containing histidine kinase [Sedimentisphaerales bacterium]